MSIINEVLAKVNSGIELADAIPAGASLSYWQKVIKNKTSNKTRPRSKPYRPSRKRSSAAQGLANIYRAEAEKVKRVNEPEPDRVWWRIDREGYTALVTESMQTSYRDRG